MAGIVITLHYFRCVGRTAAAAVIIAAIITASGNDITMTAIIIIFNITFSRRC